MRPTFTMSRFLLLLPSLSLALLQTSAQPRSPKSVIKEFWGMELGGERLTPDGWNRAAVFFLHPAPRSANEPILVVSTGNRFDQVDKDSTHAEVYVGCSELGRLSPDLRFTPSPGGPALIEIVCKYNLALTARPPQWKIVNDPPGLRISVDTAIRFVTDRRNKSSDPNIKKNADTTLATLRKLR